MSSGSFLVSCWRLDIKGLTATIIFSIGARDMFILSCKDFKSSLTTTWLSALSLKEGKLFQLTLATVTAASSVPSRALSLRKMMLCCVKLDSETWDPQIGHSVDT